MGTQILNFLSSSQLVILAQRLVVGNCLEIYTNSTYKYNKSRRHKTRLTFHKYCCCPWTLIALALTWINSFLPYYCLNAVMILCLGFSYWLYLPLKKLFLYNFGHILQPSSADCIYSYVSQELPPVMFQFLSHDLGHVRRP